MNLFTLYLGIEKDSQGRQLDAERRAHNMTALRLRASHAFGGYTLTHCEGGWINDAGVLIAEGALRVDAYTDLSVADCHAFAVWARDAFGQGAVLVEYRPAPGAQIIL